MLSGVILCIYTLANCLLIDNIDWQWMNPLPSGNLPVTVSALSDNDMWVCTQFGEILHYDGASWNRNVQKDFPEFLDMASISDTCHWLVGENNQLHHFNGTTFSTFQIPSNLKTAKKIYATDCSNFWIYGEGDILSFYNGGNWINYDLNQSAITQITGLWADTLNTFYLTVDLNDSCQFAYFDGTNYTALKTFPGRNSGDLVGYPGLHIWFTHSDSNSTITHYDGLVYTDYSFPFTVRDMAGLQNNQLWISGDYNGTLSVIGFFNGSSWQLFHATNLNLYRLSTISGINSNSALVGGYQLYKGPSGYKTFIKPQIYLFSNGIWQSLIDYSLPLDDLWCIHPFDQEKMLLGGEKSSDWSGQLSLLDNGMVSDYNLPLNRPVQAVSGSSERNFYIGQEDDVFIRYYDGTSWSSHSTRDEIERIDYRASNNIWFEGRSIYRWNGQSISFIPAYQFATGRDVDMSPNYIYLGTTRGLYRYEHSVYQFWPLPGFSGHINSISAIADELVFGIEYNNADRIHVYNHGNWGNFPIPRTLYAPRIYSQDYDKLFVWGVYPWLQYPSNKGIVYLLEDFNWSIQFRTSNPIKDFKAVNGNTIFLCGAGGILVRGTLPTPTPTPTQTNTPYATITSTPSGTPTLQIYTPTPTQTPVVTTTGTPSLTDTPTTTAVPTMPTEHPTYSPTNAPTQTPTGFTPTLTPTVTITETPLQYPNINLAGYMNTELTTYGGGVMDIFALARDSNTVEVYFQGIPTGISLTNDGQIPGVFWLKLDIPAGIGRSRFLFELQGRDSVSVSELWPYLHVK